MDVYKGFIIIAILLPIIYFFLIAIYFNNNKGINKKYWIILMTIIHVISEIIIIVIYSNCWKDLNSIVLLTKILIFIFPILAYCANFINLKERFKSKKLEIVIKNVIKNSLK